MKKPALIAVNSLLMLQHGFILLLLGPLVPEMMNSFGVGESTMGLVLSAGSLGITIGPLISGMLIDRRGLKTTIFLALGLETVLLVLFGFTSLLPLAALVNFFLMFSASGIETSVNVIPTLITEGSPGAVMNLVHFFFSVGAFIGPICIGIFLDRGGMWRTTFWAVAVPTVLLAAAVAVLRFPPRISSLPQSSPRRSAADGHGPRPVSGRADDNGPGSRTPSSPAASIFAGMWTVVKNPVVLLGGFTLFFYVGAEIGFSVWVVNYLEKLLGFPKIQASGGLSLLWIGIMAGRLGNSVLARKISAGALITASSVLGLVSGVIFIFLSRIIPVYISIFTIGLAMSGTYPNTMAAINRRFPGEAGFVTGVMTLGGGLGAMLFQWLMGMTAERAGLQLSMLIPPALMILSAGAFFAARKAVRAAGR
jgi:fucose permease